MEEKLLAIKERGLARAAGGGKRWPREFRKKNRTDSEEQERKDAMYLKDRSKNPPSSGNAKNHGSS